MSKIHFILTVLGLFISLILFDFIDNTIDLSRLSIYLCILSYMSAVVIFYKF